MTSILVEPPEIRDSAEAELKGWLSVLIDEVLPREVNLEVFVPQQMAPTADNILLRFGRSCQPYQPDLPDLIEDAIMLRDYRPDRLTAAIVMRGLALVGCWRKTTGAAFVYCH